jgi:hypothetical protein
MRVLLDVCVPKRLARELPKHEVQTATDLGWADLDDGPLLDAMGANQDVKAVASVPNPALRFSKVPQRLVDSTRKRCTHGTQWVLGQPCLAWPGDA